MALTPNVQGFADAQDRVRRLMGTDATFRIPAPQTTLTYPSGTTFDPETGMPFDPVIDPTSGGAPTEHTIKALVFHHPIMRGAQDATQMSPLGWVESASMALLISNDDHDTVQGATSVEVFGERQKILEWRPDGITVVFRWIVFLEGM